MPSRLTCGRSRTSSIATLPTPAIRTLACSAVPPTVMFPGAAERDLQAVERGVCDRDLAGALDGDRRSPGQRGQLDAAAADHGEAAAGHTIEMRLAADQLDLERAAHAVDREIADQAVDRERGRRRHVGAQLQVARSRPRR